MTDIENEEPERGSETEGAWLPEVHEALLNVITEHGIDSENYDPARPPIALIDCDDTLIHGDLGEAMMRYIITRRKLNTDRGFWHVVPERLGRDALSAAHRAVAGRADAEVRDTAAYRRYRAGMIGAYESLREAGLEELKSYFGDNHRFEDGHEAARLFAGRALRGLHERTVAELVEEVLDYELGRPLGQDDIAPGPPFGGLLVPTGVRVHTEMIGLLQTLGDYGFQTWIISSSNVYVLRALVRRIGLPEEQAIGLDFQMQAGCFTDRPVEPIPVGEGKLEQYLDVVGRSPVLMIGDSMEDFELLENCEGVSIVIDRGDEHLAERAEELGWFLQPPLSVG